jgi:galactose mutarotase-like enzyme
MDDKPLGATLDGVALVRLESTSLRVEVAPAIGGRIVSLFDRTAGHEYLWRNPAVRLQRLEPGSEYDPAFYGGIDELLPNDLPEVIRGIVCPDHGELWTTPLESRWDGDALVLHGQLRRFGLEYERRMALRSAEPGLEMTYRLTNHAAESRPFLWKLHAALAIAAGDIIECPASRGQVVDLAWSRRRTSDPFAWPIIEGSAANVIPPPDGTMDFFYLSQLAEGRMAWSRPGTGLRFEYRFDPAVFRYAWLFASYGGFEGHYTAILEPCTAMPLSVNEAAELDQCSVLPPGGTLTTRVSIRLGERQPSGSTPADFKS